MCKLARRSPNEGLTGREREDHRVGFRRATIFRRHQADLGLLLAALGAQQRHLSASSSPFQGRVGREGGVVNANLQTARKENFLRISWSSALGLCSVHSRMSQRVWIWRRWAVTRRIARGRSSPSLLVAFLIYSTPVSAHTLASNKHLSISRAVSPCSELFLPVLGLACTVPRESELVYLLRSLIKLFFSSSSFQQSCKNIQSRVDS